MVKKWLITGGCGFIGCNLVKVLYQTNSNYVRIIDNFKVGSKYDLKKVCNFKEKSGEDLDNFTPIQNHVDLIEGDILDQKLAHRICKEMDIVVHLAGNTGVAPSVEDPIMDCHSNVIGTLNFLDASRKNKVKRFIFASSGAPAGNVIPPIHENIVPHPVSPYGASKLSGEGYCSAYYHSYGLETVCLRFGNVFGPLSNKKESVIAKFIKNAMEGIPLVIYGDGSQTRDFIYVEDLIEAILKATETDGVGGEIFQIATNHETTINEIIDHLNVLLPKHGVKECKITLSQPRIGDVKRNFSDISKAKNLLGWENKNSLVQALDKTIEWYSGVNC